MPGASVGATAVSSNDALASMNNSAPTATKSGGTAHPEDREDSQNHLRLPVRWGVIVLAGIGTGVAVSPAGGPVGGVMAGAAIASLLHTFLG